MVLLDKRGLPAKAPSPFITEITVKLPSISYGYVTREFEAEIIVLYHSTTIRPNYQAMIHCGTVRQTATLISFNNDAVLRTGDRSYVRFRFIKQPEYLQLGKRLLFREGRTKGIGKIVRVFSSV
jgi:GTPase